MGGQPLSFGNTFYPYSLSTPIKMINKREADPDQVGETTHAKVYKSKVSNGDGAYYEYEVQVNRDGEGQSFQHHQQVQQKQQPKRLEEQLYHSMISNLNQVNLINEQRNQINNQQRNQINQQRNRFYQLER